MSREVEEDRFGNAFLLRPFRFADRLCDGVSRFRSRDDTFRTGEENACGQSFRLRHGLASMTLSSAAGSRSNRLRDTQTSGVNADGWKLWARVYIGSQRSEACHVAEVVLELTARQFGTRLGFDGDYAGIFTFGQVIAQEREADAGEVAASSEGNRSPTSGYLPEQPPSVSRPPRR